MSIERISIHQHLEPLAKARFESRIPTSDPLFSFRYSLPSPLFQGEDKQSLNFSYSAEDRPPSKPFSISVGILLKHPASTQPNNSRAPFSNKPCLNQHSPTFAAWRPGWEEEGHSRPVHICVQFVSSERWDGPHANAHTAGLQVELRAHAWAHRPTAHTSQAACTYVHWPTAYMA